MGWTKPNRIYLYFKARSRLVTALYVVKLLKELKAALLHI